MGFNWTRTDECKFIITCATTTIDDGWAAAYSEMPSSQFILTRNPHAYPISRVIEVSPHNSHEGGAGA